MASVERLIDDTFDRFQARLHFAYGNHVLTIGLQKDVFALENRLHWHNILPEGVHVVIPECSPAFKSNAKFAPPFFNKGLDLTKQAQLRTLRSASTFLPEAATDNIVL